nr:MAG TPA: hypothetical protein [Caudoviricetes sp.]
MVTTSHKFGVHFHHAISSLGVQHSWQGYIYSPATLYGAN